MIEDFWEKVETKEFFFFPGGGDRQGEAQRRRFSEPFAVFFSSPFTFSPALPPSEERCGLKGRGEATHPPMKKGRLQG